MKSTLLGLVRLISLFLILNHEVSAQSDPIAAADSLLSAAGKIKYQNFSKADSLYELASQKIRLSGIDSDPARWIQLLHQRTLTSLFHDKLVLARNYISETYRSLNDYSQMLTLKGDSLTIETKLSEVNYFFATGNYNEALKNLSQAESYFLHMPSNQNACSALYGILQFQATIYQLQGEFESCIDRYLASIRYYNCSRNQADFPNYILAHRNIGVAYSRMGNPSKAFYYFMKARLNFDTCPENAKTFTVRNHAAILYLSMAELYLKQKQFDSARYIYNKAMPLLSESANHVARVSEGLARVAQHEKKFELAHQLIFQALEQTIKARGEKNFVTSHQHVLISQLYNDRHDERNALLHIQKALNSLSTEDIDVHDYRKNPAAHSTYIAKIMVTTLNVKARLLSTFYNRNRSLDYLKAAWETNQLAIQILDSTRNEYSLDKDKVVLGDEATKVYETSVVLASKLFRETGDQNYLDACFALMDKSKGAVLMDHLKLVSNFSGVPKELMNRERDLKVELGAAEQRLYKAEIKREESSSHREELGRIKKQYTQLLNDIKASAPNYYKLRQGSQNLSLKKVRDNLNADEALIEYFVSDSSVYIIAVTRDLAQLYSVAADSIQENIESLRGMVARPDKLTSASSRLQWETRSRKLFTRLVKPWFNQVKPARKIIIIPHDVINYLPFEMLNDESGNLLLEKFSFSYAASESLRQEQNSMAVDGNFFAGFQADYSNQSDFPQLNGSFNEVNSIGDLLGFRSSKFSAATADDFRKQAPNFKVIHLALHSQINDEKPLFSRLIFTRNGDDPNSDITANELYGMHLNAEIAVLSACETGLGKLHRGEGMMSLSRAFMYAGVPSTLMSLWKVPDQTTSILMTNFYRSLKEGLPRDEALRMAKLNLIENHPEMAHPFFWAGFIVNGKTEPMEISNFSFLEVFAISVFVSSLIVYLVVRTIRRKKLLKRV